MFQRLRHRSGWQFFSVLPEADHALAWLWWSVLVLRGLLPAVFAIAMGTLVGAIERGDSLAGGLTLVGVVFVLLQILAPIHQALSANLGDRTAAWLYDRLTAACARPPGLAHLEDPKLTSDLTVARDFDLGITGPPLFISMDFIAGSLVEMIGGLASAVVLAAYAWWAPVLLAGAWLATHWLLRESAVWRDRHTDEVRGAQRDSDYAYRLAVDPPASKELRLFGLAEWTIDRFIASRTRLHELQYAATRLRERPRALESAPGRDGERRGVLVARRRRGERPAQPRRGRRLCPDGGRHLPDRVRWAQFRARWRGRAGGRRLAPRARHGRDGRAARRRPTGRRGPDPRDPLPRPHLRLPGRVARPRTPRPDGARRVVARDCRSQRDRQDHAGQAAVPALRPPGRHDRGRRHRPAGLRHRRLARSGHGRVPGLHPLRAVAPRQRRAGGRAGRDRAGSARGGGRRDACRPGHGTGPRLRRGHRSLRWTVAAYRPGTRAVRRAAGGRSRAARRAHRAARRPGGIRDLRPHPDGHARVHHHSHLSPFLDRATRRPHLRARRRTRRRARHAR